MTHSTTRFAGIFAAGLALMATIGTAAPARAQSEPFIGQLALFGFNFCPRNWAPADGRVLAINSNQALFALIGTIYGGDGRTTFALPDLRGRVPIAPGQAPGLSNYAIGARGGAEQVTLALPQMPSHTHAAATDARLHGTTAPAASGSPADALPADTGRTSSYATGDPVAMAADAVTATTTVAPAGAEQPHENRPPYLVANWCIALQGIFPSRN